MRVKAVTCLAVVVCCFAWSFAVQTAYLPQVANGTSAGVLSVRTTFIVFNNSTQSDSVTIRLTNNDGGAMTVTIPGLGTNSVFTFSIAAGETKVLQTDGTGAITPGAARVESTHALGVSAIFTMYNGTGGFLTQAGVGSSPALTNFVIPVDVSSGFNTGVALFAPAASSITCTLRKSDGTIPAGGTTTIPLAALKHVAKFVSGTDGLFPAVTGFTKGTVEFAATTAVAGVVLRQSTNLANTTLPVVDKTSTKTSFNLPQIANGGDIAGTNIRTTFIIFNISASNANVTINVRKPDSTAFPVTVADVNPPDLSMAEPDASPDQSGTITRTLAPGASAFLQTNGAGTISVGSATVSSNVPIGVSAIFTLYNGQTFMTEAGVGDSPVSTGFTLPVDFTASSSNGIAFFNASASTVTIDAWLVDPTGVVTRISAPISLSAYSQSAKLVSELFPGKSSFRGMLCISVTGQGVAAVTLLTNNSPLSYTTLPVVDGTFQTGAEPAAGVLLDVEKTGISATTAQTVNAQLPGGYKISGTISGSFSTVPAVRASSTASGGKTYNGDFDDTTKKYVVVVPAGTYELSFCYQPESMIPLGIPTLNYTVSPTFTVNADTTKNVTLPTATLNPISGTVTGMETIGATTGGMLTLSSADWKNGVLAMVLPGFGFSGQLPAGTYTASMAFAALGSGQTTLGFYNVGTLTVTSGGGTGAFTVPATVTVSGTVTGLPASASSSSYITVGDTSLAQPTQTTTTCSSPSSGSMGSITGGAYQLLVPKSRPLTEMVQFPVGSGTPAAGYGMYPWPAQDLGTLTANKTQNLTVPALPGLVTISGKVTNSQSQGVADVLVGAMSNQITGAAGVYYFAGAQTDSNGNYTMQVLSGTSYQMTFQPPLPKP